VFWIWQAIDAAEAVGAGVALSPELVDDVGVSVLTGCVVLAGAAPLMLSTLLAPG